MNIGPRTLGRLLKYRAEKSSDRNAIGWIENQEVKSITYKEYYHTIEGLTAALTKIGLNVGDKLAILSKTCKEWHYLDLATLCSRACVVPIYPTYLPHEIDYIFNHSDSAFIVVENEKQLEKILPYFKNWKNLKAIISIAEISESSLSKVEGIIPFYTFRELQRLGLDEAKSHPDLLENNIQNQKPEEIASIIYTSGTTGEPKGAVITQHAFTTMLFNILQTVQSAFTEKDSSLVFLPLSHVLGRTDSMLPLIFGWHSIYAESLEKVIENIKVAKPTIMIAVPRIFEKIYGKVQSQMHEGGYAKKKVFNWAVSAARKYFDKIDKDLSPSAHEILEYKLAQKLVFNKIYNLFGGRVRYFVSGGAPLSAEIIRFLRYANLTILEGYGLTETIAPCCLNPLAKQIPGTIGRPMGDVQFSFADDGEILIKTAALFSEYYKNPKATEEAIKDGWFHSGDIGQFSSEGYLVITDRKKDLIKTSGGKYVAPQKLENLAKLQPHITHMIAIGDGKKFISALIGIEKEPFLNQLEDLGLPADCSIGDLAHHSRVREIIQNEIDAINHELAQFETIKKFEIIPEEFTVENFLTPSLKIKRKVINSKYNDLIEAMYQDSPFDKRA